MKDQLEIIVRVKTDPTPMVVTREELYPIREKLDSMMLLWNTASYYVDTKQKMFIVNGGRKLFMDFEDGVKIVYRMRRSVTYGLTSKEPPTHHEAWVMGLEGIKDGKPKQVFLVIEHGGETWGWENHL